MRIVVVMLSLLSLGNGGSAITEADYPTAAREAKIEGEVIVKVIIQVDGTVTFVKFHKSDPNFDEAVRTLLQRQRYHPAVLDGKPIAVYQNLRFPFSLEQ